MDKPESTLAAERFAETAVEQKGNRGLRKKAKDKANQPLMEAVAASFKG